MARQDFDKNITEMFGVLPELMTGGITNPQDWLSLLYTGNLATPPAVPQMPVTPQNYDQDLRNTRDPDMAADSAFNRAISQVGGDLEQNMIDILASSQGKARTAAGLLPTTPMERDHPATQELIKALGTEFGVSPDAIKKEQPQQAPVIDEFSAWDPNGVPVSGIPGTNFTGKTIDEVLAEAGGDAVGNNYNVDSNRKTQEILGIYDYDTDQYQSTNPAVFETEPKEDIGLAIYHEVGQISPITLDENNI